MANDKKGFFGKLFGGSKSSCCTAIEVEENNDCGCGQQNTSGSSQQTQKSECCETTNKMVESGCCDK